MSFDFPFVRFLGNFVITLIYYTDYHIMENAAARSVDLLVIVLYFFENESINNYHYIIGHYFANVPMNTEPISKWSKGVILIRSLLLFPFLKFIQINNILSDNVHTFYIYTVTIGV